MNVGIISELAATFAFSFTLALSGALMPGPMLTVTVAESAKRGFISGPLIVAGHAILELTLVVAVILGTGPILKMHLVQGTIALVGGGILFWMGIGMVRASATISLNAGTQKRGLMSNPVLAGILSSVSNPYWILWWGTIGLGYLISAMKLGAPGVVSFYFGHISADFIWYTSISFGISRGKNILGDGAYRWIVRVCGVILVFFGGWFLYTSYKCFT
jgi:threonine/homoserine/homoserine lactone efflux protein